MDLLQLKYFQTVARLEHMTQAAHQLCIAQSSLSQTIAHLEKDLGVPLFDRQGRQIRLNPFGRALLRYGEHIFGELEDARHEIADLADRERGRIALSVVLPQILLDLLGTFRALHPHVSFHLFHQHRSAKALVMGSQAHKGGGPAWRRALGPWEARMSARADMWLFAGLSRRSSSVGRRDCSGSRPSRP